MKKLEESYKILAELQELDPKIFYPDNNVSKELCGFILGLALFSNDIKSIYIFYETLLDSKPKGKEEKSKENGAYNGLRIFLERLLIGFLHELFEFITDNEIIIKHTYFKNIINQLDMDRLNSWNVLVQISTNSYYQNKDYQDLLKIRNNVSFHYSSKELYRGYKYFFEKLRPDMSAYYSCGKEFNKTRFYFSEAAAQGYIDEKTSFSSDPEFYKKLKTYIESFDNVIQEIIIKFLEKRKDE